MSDISCYGYYLLEIYENGEFEFRSTGLKKLGIYKSQIRRNKLDALIKKFVDAEFMAADNRQPYLGFSGAIRFQQGELESTVVSPSTSANPLIKELVSEIIETAQVKQWLPNNQATKIPDEKNIKRVEPCMSRDLAVMFEQMKIY